MLPENYALLWFCVPFSWISFCWLVFCLFCGFIWFHRALVGHLAVLFFCGRFGGVMVVFLVASRWFQWLQGCFLVVFAGLARLFCRSRSLRLCFFQKGYNETCSTLGQASKPTADAQRSARPSSDDETVVEAFLS